MTTHLILIYPMYPMKKEGMVDTAPVFGVYTLIQIILIPHSQFPQQLTGRSVPIKVLETVDESVIRTRICRSS